MRRGAEEGYQSRRQEGDRNFAGRGDRSRSGPNERDRRDFRGGRPGQGGGGGPKKAETRPGQEEWILSNNFRIKFNGADKAYIYSIDFGAGMEKGWQRGAAYMNAKEAIQAVYGKTARFRSDLLAFQKVSEQKSFPSKDNEDLETVITVKLTHEVDLENISSSKHRDVLTSFVSAICKDTLVQSDFKQVGRLPRFFDTSKAK